YTLLRDLYEAGWRRENRPYWLGNVLARYDAATRLWLGRIDRFNDVLAQWWSTKQLPSPSELGLPSRQRSPVAIAISAVTRAFCRYARFVMWAATAVR